MTTTYPHVYVLEAETRIPGLNSRRTYSCACGSALNVPQYDTERKERIEGDNCPASMRAWLDGADAAIAKAKAETAAVAGDIAAAYEKGRHDELKAVGAWLISQSRLTITTGREQDVYAATVRAAAECIADGEHRVPPGLITTTDAPTRKA